MMDRTNVPNPHQQSLRYGWFDAAAVMDRVERDWQETCAVLPHAARSLLVTHLNETGGQLAGGDSLEELIPRFDRVILSDSPCEIYS